ncbi:MAG: DMT family transporter [bacterium]|nr:DMT family transporter [bacterium]
MANPIKWFNAKGYAQGVFWIIMVSLISNMNDIIMRLTGDRLPSMEIAFFRFFFGVITLLPLMLSKGPQAFKTSRPLMHGIRAILGFCAVALWCYGVGEAPLVVVSTIALTVPLFVLPMASLVLKENVGWQRTVATLAGFGGILVVVTGASEGFSLDALQIGALGLVAAAILFAVSDIFNKIMLKTETSLTLLFYFAVGTTIAGIIPAYLVWVTPTISELLYLFVLGAGGNLILYCLLKAFSATEVSALAPYRYVELGFAMAFGFLLFGEIPGLNHWIGIAIIVPCTLAIAYYEIYQRKKASQTQKPTMDSAKKEKKTA